MKQEHQNLSKLRASPSPKLLLSLFFWPSLLLPRHRHRSLAVRQSQAQHGVARCGCHGHGRAAAPRSPGSGRHHLAVVAPLHARNHAALLRILALQEGHAPGGAGAASPGSFRHLPPVPVSRHAPPFHPLWPDGPPGEKIESAILARRGSAASRSIFQLGASGVCRNLTCNPFAECIRLFPTISLWLPACVGISCS